MRNLSGNILTEKDKAANRPLDLYRLVFPHATLYLASSMEDIEFFDENGNAQTYMGYDISRGDIQTNIALSTQDVAITIGNIDLSFSELLKGIDIRNSAVSVLKVFRDHLDAPGHEIKLFEGRVDGLELDETAVLLNVVGRIDLIERNLPARKYSLQCSWEFGDHICGIEVPTVSGEVVSIDTTGREIEVDAILGSDPHEWIYGDVTIGQESRYIVDSTANSIIVDVPFLYSIIGESCDVRAGCSKFYGHEEDEEIGDMHGCQYWENTDRFGGFLNIPDGKDTQS